MITDYQSNAYRISYQGVSMIENALENPNLIQVGVVPGCTIMVAPQKSYGIDYLPNGEYRSWTLTGYNTRLNRTEAHYIYARLERDSDDAMVLFSVNDYATDGSIGGENPSEDFYYIRIGSITATDKLEGATLDREITLDYGKLSTPAGNEQDDTSGWKELFELTAEGLIRPLKRFTSFIVQGTLSIIGKLVINDKQITDVARQGDNGDFTPNDESVPTTGLLTGKYLEYLRKIFLNKDREDSTDFLQKFLGGIILPFVNSKSFTSGILGSGFTLREDENGISYLEVDKMLVRMKAIFQVLEILKVELGGASFLFNASGARATITKVEQIEQEAYFIDGDKGYFPNEDEAYFPDIYRCYFMTDDGETAVENLFKVGDFVRSQTFNIKAGVHENVSNHYWWRKVVGVGEDYIDISSVNYQEDSDIPKEGDVIVQLGNDRDEDRQSAIVLSAYGEGAPYLTMYQGINSYSLKDKDIFTIGYDNVKKECYLKNYGRAYIGARDGKVYFDFSNNKLAIKADSFIFSTGETVKDKLDSNEQEIGKVSERISSEVKLLNDQISLKVSSETFNSAIDQITESVSSEIKIVKDEISLKVSSNDLENAIDGINSQLIQTGIDITKKTVTVTAQSFFVNNSKGTPIAVFTTDSSGKPILKADYIDVNNLKVKHLDGADGTFSGELKAATGTFTGGVVTNSDGNRIILDPDSRQMALVSSTGTMLSSWFFYNNSGYESAALYLKNIEGESLYIYPFDIRMTSGNNSTQITNGDIRLKMGTSSMIINPTQISMAEGDNSVIGFTGSFLVYSLYDESKPTSEKIWKKVSVKNGIIYKIENWFM